MKFLKYFFIFPQNRNASTPREKYKHFLYFLKNKNFSTVCKGSEIFLIFTKTKFSQNLLIFI